MDLITSDVAQDIAQIRLGMECKKGFRCLEDGGICRLCDAKDIGLENHLECKDGNPSECQYAMSYGHTYLCRCPLRKYLYKLVGSP